jgi:hypothetical protein
MNVCTYACNAARRRVLMTGLTGLAGSLLPWQFAHAQAIDKSMLAIAYPVDVPTWHPGAVTIPAIQGIYETVFDTPLRFSPDIQLQPRQIKTWKWLDDKDTRLESEHPQLPEAVRRRPRAGGHAPVYRQGRAVQGQRLRGVCPRHARSSCRRAPRTTRRSRIRKCCTSRSPTSPPC